MTSTTNYVSEWINRPKVPFGVEPMFAEEIVRKRRQILIYSYLRWGLDKNCLENRKWVEYCRRLTHLQAAWGWDGYNYYDALFKDFRHVFSARQLITNRGMDVLLNGAAVKMLHIHEEANRREGILQ